MNTQLRDKIDELYVNMLVNYKMYSWTQDDNRKEVYERYIKYDLRRMLAAKLDSMVQSC